MVSFTSEGASSRVLGLRFLLQGLQWPGTTAEALRVTGLAVVGTGDLGLRS